MLLQYAVWLVRWPYKSLVPLDYLPRPGALHLGCLWLQLMNAVHEAGFAVLGFAVGLAALWSP